jgi:hypothetical protein
MFSMLQTSSRLSFSRSLRSLSTLGTPVVLDTVERGLPYTGPLQVERINVFGTFVLHRLFCSFVAHLPTSCASQAGILDWSGTTADPQ